MFTSLEFTKISITFTIVGGKLTEDVLQIRYQIGTIFEQNVRVSTYPKNDPKSQYEETQTTDAGGINKTELIVCRRHIASLILKLALCLKNIIISFATDLELPDH